MARKKTATVTITRNRDGTYKFKSRNYDLRKLFPPQTKPEEIPASETPIAFGLEAQGHIPAVEAAIAEGADWQEIGRRIGWDGETAKTYYERHLARTSPSSSSGKEG